MTVKKHGSSWGYYFGFKNKRYRKRGFATRREAVAAETDAKDKLNKGGIIDDKLDFLKYYTSWHKLNKEGTISEVSYNTYMNAGNQFKEYLEIEKLYPIALKDVNQTIYRGFLKWYGNTHTTESVRKMHYCLKQALNDALQDGLIHKDPTYNAKPKGMKESKTEEEKFMTIKDFKDLKEYVSQKPVLSHLFIYMLIITGSRFSGIRNMRYEYIDEVKNQLYIHDTKNETSPRWVTINPNEMTYIKQVLKNNQHNLNGYIFHTGSNLITHNAVDKVFQRFLVKQGCGHYTLHALRHTHCSVLLHEGISIYYVSKRLGHKSIQTTMTTYSHLLEETKDREEEKALKAIASL